MYYYDASVQQAMRIDTTKQQLLYNAGKRIEQSGQQNNTIIKQQTLSPASDETAEKATRSEQTSRSQKEGEHMQHKKLHTDKHNSRDMHHRGVVTFR